MAATMESIYRMIDEVSCFSTYGSLSDQEKYTVMLLVARVCDMKERIKNITAEKHDLLLYTLMLTLNAYKNSFSSLERQKISELVSILKHDDDTSNSVGNGEDNTMFGSTISSEEGRSPNSCIEKRLKGISRENDDSDSYKELKFTMNKKAFSATLGKILQAKRLIEKKLTTDNVSTDDNIANFYLITENGRGISDSQDYLFLRNNIHPANRQEWRNIYCFPMSRVKCRNTGYSWEIMKQSCIILREYWKRTIACHNSNIRVIEYLTEATFTFNSCEDKDTVCYFTIAASLPKQIRAALATLDFVIKYNIHFSLNDIDKICRMKRRKAIRFATSSGGNNKGESETKPWTSSKHSDSPEHEEETLVDEQDSASQDASEFPSNGARTGETIVLNAPRLRDCTCYSAMNVDNRYSGRLLGPNGSIAKIIQHFTHTRIRLNEADRSDNKRRLQIAAKYPEHIACAKDFIGLLTKHQARFGKLIDSLLNDEINDLAMPRIEVGNKLFIWRGNLHARVMNPTERGYNQKLYPYSNGTVDLGKFTKLENSSSEVVLNHLLGFTPRVASGLASKMDCDCCKQDTTILRKFIAARSDADRLQTKSKCSDVNASH